MKKFSIIVWLFCAILLGFNQKSVRAQSHNFYQTGQIRPIVSETEGAAAPRRDSARDAEYSFSGDAKSTLKFYFTYSVAENGVITEKWAALPGDRDWSRLSNQTVRISGSLSGGTITNAAVSPLTEMPESYQTAPPATVGLYKVVAVPLTIQPVSSAGKPDKEAALNVTAAEIRNNLFDAPNSVNKFYLEASYGKFGFTGVTHPQAEVVPVTIQAAISNNCQEQIVSEFTPIVRERLRDQNIDTTNGSVDLGIIIFNDTPGCPPYPFATRGALGKPEVPLWVWMPESWFATGPAILAHEIGHALGGNHPVVARCANFDDPQTCVYTDAADRDIMTSSGRFYMMPNNYERRRWGWHSPGAFDIPSSGFVYMFDLQSSALPFGKQSSRRGRYFFRNLSGSYAGWDVYPEARRNWGQFERYKETDESFQLGIAVRYGHSNYGDSEAVSIIIDPNKTAGLEDAPLRENQQISIGGVLIECIREGNPTFGTRMRVR